MKFVMKECMIQLGSSTTISSYSKDALFLGGFNTAITTTTTTTTAAASVIFNVIVRSGGYKSFIKAAFPITNQDM